MRYVLLGGGREKDPKESFSRVIRRVLSERRRDRRGICSMAHWKAVEGRGDGGRRAAPVARLLAA